MMLDHIILPAWEIGLNSYTRRISRKPYGWLPPLCSLCLGAANSPGKGPGGGGGEVLNPVAPVSYFATKGTKKVGT